MAPSRYWARIKLGMRFWAASIVMLALSVPADAEQSGVKDGMGWLTAMRQAVSLLNYRGVVAYLKDKQVESFQILHAASPNGGRERLISMNSPLREVIRTADKMVCYFPENKSVFVENKATKRSMLLDLPDDLTTLSRFYQIKAENQEIVARHLSQVISIQPRDGLRYARKIWVDTDSKLPLKFELLGEDGQVVEQMVFTAVTVESSIPAAELEPTTPVDHFTWQVNERENMPLEKLDWTMDSVPDGFQLISYTRLKRPNSDVTVDHILLSDGVSSVSIYIDPLKQGARAPHHGNMGAISAFSRDVDDHSVTVMGEVPARTVKLIAEGIKPGAEADH